MAYKKTPTPSKLELVSCCAAAYKRCLPFPFVENEHTIRGKELHEIVSVLLGASPDILGTAKRNIFAKLNEKDREGVETCLEVARLLKPKGPHYVFNEQRLDLAFLNIPAGGKPDYGFYDENSGTIVMIDWKFGFGAVPDPDSNKQLHAYGLGGTRYVMPKQVKQMMVVVCQPHGRAVESYRQAIIPASEFGRLEGQIRNWIDLAMGENPAVFPGPHCTSSFCEAGKQGVCPEFLKWKTGVTEAKEQKKDIQVKDAVAGFNPIVIEGPGPSFPVVVFSQEAVERARALLAQATAITVVDQSSADAAGLLLNEITTFESLIEKNKKAVKAPFLEINKKIEEKAAQALQPLGTGKSELKSELDTWVNDELAKQVKERQEADQKKRDAEAAQQKADQDAAAALQAAANNPTAESVEAARKAKEEADKKAEEAKQAAAVPVIPVAPIKVMETKRKKVPVFEVTDFKAMPDTYKIVNEKLLKAAVETGAVKDEPWIKITWEEQSSSSGRKN